jgi:hypothetical protein
VPRSTVLSFSELAEGEACRSALRRMVPRSAATANALSANHATVAASKKCFIKGI